MALNSIKNLLGGGSSKQPSGPTWKPPRLLDQGPLTGPKVVIDGRNFAVSMWRREGGIQGTTHTTSGGWDPAATAIDPGPGCGLPELVMNADGKALAAWIRREGPTSEIVVRWIKGSLDGENARVARVIGAAEQLQVTLDRRGDALLAWVVDDGGSHRVESLGCDGRTGIWDEKPTNISGPLASGPLLRLALGARGEALAIWSQYGAPFEGLVTCHYFAKERTWADRPQSVMPGSIRGLDLALDEQGNGVALTVCMENGRQVMDALAYQAAQAAWHRPVRLAGALEIQQPQVRIADGGATMVVWRQSERAGTSRLFTKAMRGGQWETRPTSLDTDLGIVRTHALSMTSGGRAVVLFTQVQGTQESVYVRTFQHGAWNAVPTQLNAPSPHTHHSVAADRNQTANVCVWMLGNAAQSGLMGSFGK